MEKEVRGRKRSYLTFYRDFSIRKNLPYKHDSWARQELESSFMFSYRILLPFRFFESLNVISSKMDAFVHGLFMRRDRTMWQNFDRSVLSEICSNQTLCLFYWDYLLVML